MFYRKQNNFSYFPEKSELIAFPKKRRRLQSNERALPVRSQKNWAYKAPVGLYGKTIFFLPTGNFLCRKAQKIVLQEMRAFLARVSSTR
jgi:hypothetical protein